jgi:predicted short-subunit dehydrogenase-like oxidoreductase (DUF2520 family)
MIKSKNISVAAVGAGKLAWSLIPALTNAGYKPDCLITRKLSSAKKAADTFNIKSCSDKLKNIPADSGLVLLMLPDDQIEITAKQISSFSSNVKNKIFIHFSGVYSSSILGSLSSKGALTGSFHIMQTFPSRKISSIKGSYAAVESPAKEINKFLFKLASDLELNAFEVDPSRKAEYHLAGVFASNFLVSNLFAAEKLFRQSGSKAEFLKFIDPILSHTMENIKNKGSVNSTSGPVDRGDLHTIKLHVKALKGQKQLLHSYIIQSLNILDIKKEQGGILPAHKEIKKYLTEKLKRMA